MPRFVPEPHGFLRHIETPYPSVRPSQTPQTPTQGPQARAQVSADQFQSASPGGASPEQLAHFVQTYQWRHHEVDPQKQARFDFFLRMGAGPGVADLAGPAHPGRPFGQHLSARLARHGPEALWQYFTTPSQDEAFGGPQARAPQAAHVGVHGHLGAPREHVVPPAMPNMQTSFVGGMAPQAVPMTSGGMPWMVAQMPPWAGGMPMFQVPQMWGAMASHLQGMPFDLGSAGAGGPMFLTYGQPAPGAAPTWFVPPQTMMQQPGLQPLGMSSQMPRQFDAWFAAAAAPQQFEPWPIAAATPPQADALQSLTSDASRRRSDAAEQLAAEQRINEAVEYALQFDVPAPALGEVPQTPALQQPPPQESTRRSQRTTTSQASRVAHTPRAPQAPEVAATPRAPQTPVLVQAPVLPSQLHIPEQGLRLPGDNDPSPDMASVLAVESVDMVSTSPTSLLPVQTPMSRSGMQELQGVGLVSPTPAPPSTSDDAPISALEQVLPLSTSGQPTAAQKTQFLQLALLEMAKLPLAAQPALRAVMMACRDEPRRRILRQLGLSRHAVLISYYMTLIAIKGPAAALNALVALSEQGKQRRDHLPMQRARPNESAPSRPTAPLSPKSQSAQFFQQLADSLEPSNRAGDNASSLLPDWNAVML